MRAFVGHERRTDHDEASAAVARARAGRYVSAVLIRIGVLDVEAGRVQPGRRRRDRSRRSDRVVELIGRDAHPARLHVCRQRLVRSRNRAGIGKAGIGSRRGDGEIHARHRTVVRLAAKAGLKSRDRRDARELEGEHERRFGGIGKFASDAVGRVREVAVVHAVEGCGRITAQNRAVARPEQVRIGRRRWRRSGSAPGRRFGRRRGRPRCRGRRCRSGRSFGRRGRSAARAGIRLPSAAARSETKRERKDANGAG